MQSYRKRIVIQKKHKEPMVKHNPFILEKKDYRSETKTYISKAIFMYKNAASSFEPFSDEEKHCRDEIFKYTIDLEILERGTYEERKEVVEKYGRGISQAIHKSRIQYSGTL